VPGAVSRPFHGPYAPCIYPCHVSVVTLPVNEAVHRPPRKPFGQWAGQHEVALGHCDEGVSEPVEPEAGAAGSAYAGMVAVEVLEMAGDAHGRGEHQPSSLPPASARRRSLQHGGDLAGERKLQRLAGLGLLDTQDAAVQIDALPAERDHLAQAHAGVGSDQEDVAVRGR